MRHDGVPQESVLVPVVFILHINDPFFDDKMLIFADDTKLMNKGVLKRLSERQFKCDLQRELLNWPL